MGHIDGMINFKMICKDLCLADNYTTHTILRDKKYFQYLILNKDSANTISGSLNENMLSIIILFLSNISHVLT